MGRFAERTAVVTGAASGIGYALARQLLAEGARVVMADVEAAALDTAAAEVGAHGEVIAVAVDVRDAAAVDALAARTREHFGIADLVFANAGVSTSGATWATTADDWAWVMGVNVLGVAHTVRSFVPPLIASGRPGRVCITASIAGYLNQPGFGAYNASKHAVAGIAESLAADLREAGYPITVTMLAPWFVRTKLAQAGRNRPAELGEATPPSEFSRAVSARMSEWSFTTQTPDDVARLALDAVAEGHFAVFPYEPSKDAARARIEAVLSGGIGEFYLPER